MTRRNRRLLFLVAIVFLAIVWVLMHRCCEGSRVS